MSALEPRETPRTLFGVLLLASAVTLSANESVDVNLNVEHSVGGVSEFDRETYMVLHAGIIDNDWDSDTQRSSFLSKGTVQRLPR